MGASGDVVRPGGHGTGVGEGPSTSYASWVGRMASQPRVSSACLAWLKMCRALQRRIPDKAFKQIEVAYVPGAVVGREKRRSLVRRLQVQHAVCMLMKLQRRDELLSVEEAFRLLGQKKGQTVFGWARERALEQELGIFGAGKGPTLPVYTSMAGKLSALDWWETKFRAGGEWNDEEDDDDGSGGGERDGGTKSHRKSAEKGLDETTTRKRGLEEREIDFEYVQVKRRRGMHNKIKPIIMELIDEQMVGDLAPERKLELLEQVQAQCDTEMTPQATRRCNDEQLRAMLAPIVLKATEPVRHIQKLQFTKM